MSRVRLKPFLAWTRPSETILSIAGGGLEVFIEGDHAEVVAAVLPVLDGRPLAGVAAESGVDEEDLEAVLDALRGKKLVDEIEDREAFDDRNPLSPYTFAPNKAAKLLAAADIVVLGAGRAAEMVGKILEESGAKTPRRDGVGGDFVILALDAPEQGALDRAWQTAAGAPFTQVVLEGASAIAGPTSLEGHACPTCFETRRNNLSLTTNARANLAAALIERAARAEPNAPLVHQAAAIAAREAMLHASGVMRPVLCDRVAEITTAGETRWHHLLPVPNCTRCGGA